MGARAMQLQHMEHATPTDFASELPTDEARDGGAEIVPESAHRLRSRVTADGERRHANAALDAVRRVVRALRASNHETEKSFRLSAAQLFMLSQIALQPKQSLSDVARSTLTSPSSASEVLTKLVRRGLVSRRVSATDRRRLEFSLSEDGARLLDLAPQTVPERLVAGFVALPPEQQEALARGLGAWVASAQLSDVPATMFMEEERRT
jgi:DNA-binding MarR family transcriptional regulator